MALWLLLYEKRYGVHVVLVAEQRQTLASLPSRQRSQG